MRVGMMSMMVDSRDSGGGSIAVMMLCDSQRPQQSSDMQSTLFCKPMAINRTVWNYF